MSFVAGMELCELPKTSSFELNDIVFFFMTPLAPLLPSLSLKKKKKKKTPKFFLACLLSLEDDARETGAQTSRRLSAAGRTFLNAPPPRKEKSVIRGRNILSTTPWRRVRPLQSSRCECRRARLYFWRVARVFLPVCARFRAWFLSPPRHELSSYDDGCSRMIACLPPQASRRRRSECDVMRGLCLNR